MRIYNNFNESMNEIRRDLAEMGTEYQSNSYQNKDVSKDPDFITKEIINYLYTVINPNTSFLLPTQPWADQEFEERISYLPINPGEAYKSRPDVWNQFLNNEGLFDYSYSERFCGGPKLIIEELKRNPQSRQLFLPMFMKKDLHNLGGLERIPCTLGYLFQLRGQQLNITYLQRSADFATHFHNDCYLAVKMMEYIAKEAGVKAGMFSHWIGSLHIFAKDVKGVF